MMKMPLYQSHKIVRALQIKSLDGVTLHFRDGRSLAVAPAMFTRYSPVDGDYYVVYDDGYASISPKEAFEKGYRRVSDD